MADKNRKKNHSAKEDIINRVYILYAIFIIAGLAIAARLIWIQVADKNVEKHIKVMERNITNTEIDPAHRGAILTRNGEPLAMSSLRHEPIVDFASEGMLKEYKKDKKSDPDRVPRELKQLAQQMAHHFNKADAQIYGYKYRSMEEYYDLFMSKFKAKKGNRAVRIFPRPVVLDEWNMMRRDFPIINYSLGRVYKDEEVEVRMRPHEDLALMLIGECRGERSKTPSYEVTRTNGDSTYTEIIYKDTIVRRTTGLENIYDSLLAGVNGQYIEQRIAHGFWARKEDPRNRKPEDGHDVVTTIDGDLQRMATECLRKQLEKECGSFGVAMVMEVETGNMLCMVNLSSGRQRGHNYQENINHAMRTRMTPGSTFKLASAMALLEIGGATVNTKVSVPDAEEKVGKRTIRDTHTMRDEEGTQITNPTLVEGFAHSSNIFFSRAVYERFKNDPSVYTTFLNSLMLNSHIGLEEFGAKRGLVPSPKSDTWKVNGGPEWVFPQMPYGYVVEIPPIQTLTLYNGVANGGKMMAPRFVDRIEKGGITVERMPYETLLEHMCSEQTIDGLFTCLKAAAVPDRMGRRFGNLPVNIGCKTGTAQLWGAFPTNTPLDSLNFIEGFGPDKHEYYLGSLVAIMPIEKPKYTIMVAIAKEKTDEHPTYYGGRVAGDVVCDIIEFLHTNDLTLHPRVEDSGKGYRPTTIKDGKASSVARITESLCNMNYADGLDSEWCSAFVDESGSTTVQSLNIASGRVPNVQGMGLVDALFLLEQQGLEVTHSGVGRVTKQSIPHGSKITDKRRKIHLTLSI